MNEIRVYESTCRWVRYRTIWDFLATAQDIGWEEMQNTSPAVDPLHEDAMLLIQFQPAIENARKEGEDLEPGMVYSQEWLGKTIHSIPYAALQPIGQDERNVMLGVRSAYNHTSNGFRGAKFKQLVTRVFDSGLDAEIDEMRLKVDSLSDAETSAEMTSRAAHQEYLEGLELITGLRECFKAREATSLV